MDGGGTVQRRVARRVMGALLTVGALSGCVSARNSLGTSDSPCYLDLPAAARAVGGHGHFLGIHLFSLAKLGALAPHLTENLSDAKSTAAHVCVAAYEGTFTASQVAKPLGRSHGHLAVVVVDSSNQRLLATVIIAKPPIQFGHPHMG
jgi:hypothetical protein